MLKFTLKVCQYVITARWCASIVLWLSQFVCSCELVIRSCELAVGLFIIAFEPVTDLLISSCGLAAGLCKSAVRLFDQ